jgi:hypothetical protein
VKNAYYQPLIIETTDDKIAGACIDCHLIVVLLLFCQCESMQDMVKTLSTLLSKHVEFENANVAAFLNCSILKCAHAQNQYVFINNRFFF